MLVVRTRLACRPERTEEVAVLLSRAVAPCRRVDGVVSYDIGRDVTAPDTFLVTEVYADAQAADVVAALPEVAAVMAALDTAAAGEPEAAVYTAEPAGPPPTG